MNKDLEAALVISAIVLVVTLAIIGFKLIDDRQSISTNEREDTPQQIAVVQFRVIAPQNTTTKDLNIH